MEDGPRWVLGLTENDLVYQNVLTRVTSGTTNPCKGGLWDVLLDDLHHYRLSHNIKGCRVHIGLTKHMHASIHNNKKAYIPWLPCIKYDVVKLCI